MTVKQDRVLVELIRKGSIDEAMIAKLIDDGANPNGGSSVIGYPLIEAIRGGNTDIVKLLLSRGASLTKQYDRKGTALHYAIREKKINIIKIILEHGASPDADYEQDWDLINCLQLAVDTDDADILQALKDHNVNLKSHMSGFYIFEYAISNCKENAVKFFIDNGFDPNKSYLDIDISIPSPVKGDEFWDSDDEQWAMGDTPSKDDSDPWAMGDNSSKDDSDPWEITVASAGAGPLDAPRKMESESEPWEITAASASAGPVDAPREMEWDSKSDPWAIITGPATETDYSTASAAAYAGNSRYEPRLPLEHDKKKQYPLLSAVDSRYTSVEIILALVTGGAATRIEGALEQPLQSVVRRNNIQSAIALLGVGADPNYPEGRNSPLCMALESCNAPMAELLIDNGADLKVAFGHYRRALIKAIDKNNLEMVKLLIDKGLKAHINIIKESESWHPLAKAIHYGESRKEITKLLIDSGANVTLCSLGEQNSLNLAVERDQVDVANWLLDANFPPNTQGIHGFYPIHIAAKNGNTDLIQALIEKGADVSVVGPNGAQALYWAVTGGHIDIVRKLLEAGADPNVKGLKGSSIIHTAIEGENTEIAELLVNNGADINAVSENGKSLSDIKINRDNRKLMKLLAESGSVLGQMYLIHNMNKWLEGTGRPKLTEKGFCSGLSSYWMIANMVGGEALAFFEKSESMLLTTTGNELVELESAFNEHHEKRLKKEDIDTELSQKSEKFETIASFLDTILLYQSGSEILAGTSHKDISVFANLTSTKYIYESGFSFGSVFPSRESFHEVLTSIMRTSEVAGMKDSFSFTNGYHAASVFREGDKYVFMDPNDRVRNVCANIEDLESAILKAMHNAKFPFELQVKHLDFSSEKKRPFPDPAALHDKIISRCGSNNMKSLNGFTPLSMCMSVRDMVGIKKYATQESVNYIREACYGYNSPMLFSSMFEGSDVLDSFVAVGGDIKIVGPDGANVLYSAVANRNPDAVSYALDAGLDPNALGVNGFLPLHRAIDVNNKEIAQSLLDNGADLEKSASNGATPLYWAVLNGSLEWVKFLLHKGANPNVPGIDNWYPIHKAIGLGRADIVDTLIKAETDLSVKKGQNHDEEPLYYAVDRGNLKIVNLLLENRADPNASGINGFYPLHRAVSINNADIVRALVSKGADINKCARNGASPLYLAVNNGNLEMVELLIKLGASTNIPGIDNYYPIHRAVSLGNLEIVQALVEGGADLQKCLPNGADALYHSVDQDKVHIARFLLEKGAEKDVPGIDKYYPIHRAITVGSSEMVSLLKESGADLSIKAPNGQDAYGMAFKTGNSKLIRAIRTPSANHACRASSLRRF